MTTVGLLIVVGGLYMATHGAVAAGSFLAVAALIAMAVDARRAPR